MEFDTSIGGGKAPRDGTTMGIALGFQSGNALSQDLQALHTARQAASRENGDLDFGHVEPAAVFGGIMANQTPKMYLPLCDQADEPVLELRASINNALLATVCASGVLLWERRSNQRFVLSWDELAEQMPKTRRD